MSAAAASSRARRASRVEAENRRVRKHKVLVREQQKRIKRCKEKFNAFSEDGEFLEVHQVREFISEVLEVEMEEVTQDAVDMVTGLAKKQSSRGFELKLSLDALEVAIEKYSEYIRRKSTIDKIFRDFDKTHDGKLHRDELRNLLEARERNNNRSAGGVVFHLVIQPSDIDFILQKSDIDGDGMIDKHEILSAIATWEELAHLEMERQQKMCPCAIL